MKKLSCAIVSILLTMLILVTANINSEFVSAEIVEGLSAKSYVVMDNNGKVLMENNMEERREVASICKLMTTLITLEKIDSGDISLDDKVIASEYACGAEGSQAFLDAGSEYSIRDLLKSVIVASANDSAIVLAEFIGGTETDFVTIMNAKAKEIGMNNTLYANSTGLPAENQYSTARDTAIILNEISDYKTYKEDCKIWMDKLVHPSGRETELVNTNRLIKYYPNCVTGKTGFTDEAGYCLSSTALKNNLKLTCVVLGCDTSADRFSDSVALYNKAYATFKSVKVIDKNVLIENNIKVTRGKESHLEIVPEEDYYITLKNGDSYNYQIEYDVNESIQAPVQEGDVVGIINIVLDNEIVGSVNIVANNQIEKQNFKDIFNKIIDNYSFIK